MSNISEIEIKNIDHLGIVAGINVRVVGDTKKEISEVLLAK